MTLQAKKTGCLLDWVFYHYETDYPDLLFHIHAFWLCRENLSGLNNNRYAIIHKRCWTTTVKAKAFYIQVGSQMK